MIFIENQQFYILKVHEEIISAWKHLRNVNINIRSSMWKKRCLFAPNARMATLF